MKILVLGSGGREHVFAWMLSKSVAKEDLFVAPGNAGTHQIAQNVNLKVTDFESIGEFVINNDIDIVIPGSEDPLVEGIVDYFEGDPKLESTFVLGPSKEAAQLEGSKEYAKQFMSRHGIPTAAYEAFTADTVEEGKAFLASMKAPYVLKADGLAAGKGVLIIQDLKEAQDSLADMLNGKFGEASSRVVIEEFLSGIEFSVFALTDGENYVLLPEAKDYKRIGEGDTGLNTGGMGAVSPVPFFSGDFKKKVIDQVVQPTISGLKKDGLKYTGFVFFGLIMVGQDPYVIEYNVRMGDPETEVVFPRVDSDLLELIELTRSKRLKDAQLDITSNAATTIFMVSGGYPESYEKGKEMDINEVGSILFHAGTKLEGDKVVTSGGRVIAATSIGKNIDEALNKSYKAVEHIRFEGSYYRKDIGQDILALSSTNK